MATEDDVEDVIEELNDAIADVADDTERWSQEQSAQIFEEVASVANMRAQAIRQEIAGG